MRTIVIGASGFVGRNIMKAISRESDVIGTQNSGKDSALMKYDMSKDSFKEKFGKYFWDHQEIMEHGNKFYGIIAAAIRQMEQVQDSSAEKLNIDKTIDLINDMVELKIKPVFISTSYVYEGVHEKYVETDKINPQSEYARQKSVVEKYLMENVKDYLIYRIDKIVDEFPKGDHLFNQWYDSIKKGDPIKCIKDQYFSPIFVQDVANAVAIGCKLDLSGIYNLSNNQPIYRAELARKFLHHMKRNDVPIIEGTLEELNLSSRPLRTNIDSSKFLRDVHKKGGEFKFTSMDEVMENFAGHVDSMRKYQQGHYINSPKNSEPANLSIDGKIEEK
ncbi:MAG TPA: sugar nucleotide-binding protein [Alphaproteobacteria bacterium]|nr:sugar nucleotide-binding protein [Alphaproteobacteria bacterium]